MTSALDVAKRTVARASQSYVRNGKSYCQTFAGNFWEAHFGRQTPNSYPTATAAYKASKIASLDPNTAPPGAYHYFEYGGQGGAGHVGVELGSGRMASATGYTKNVVEDLGKGVKVHKVSDYAKHLKYLGWSYTNGNRAQITGLTDSYAQPVGPNQRKVGSVEVRRRTQPNTSSPYNGDLNLPPGSVHTVEGWITGEAVSGNNVWFKIGGLYSHSGSFTSQSINGLNDLNLRPNERTIRSDIANSRTRKGPTTESEQLGVLDPGTRHTVTLYKKGQKVTVSGITSDVWYVIGDGYASAATFTSQYVGDLTEIKDTPTPPPTPAPTKERQVKPDNGVNIRTAPKTSASLKSSLDRGTTITVEEYVDGERVTSGPTTSSVWYVVDGGYAWAGGFTSQSVEGITKAEYKEPDDKPIYPSNKPVVTNAFPGVVTEVIPAHWSNFENQYSVPNAADRVGFPAKPKKVVLHQFGEPGINTYQSVINTFTGEKPAGSRVSSHFVVSEDKIVQMVNLNQRAYHAGAGGNDFVGIEIDPTMSDTTIASLRKLLEALRDWNDGEPLENILHRDVPGATTACGKYIAPHLDKLDVSVKPSPEPQPEPSPADGISKEEFAETLIEMASHMISLANKLNSK